MCRPIYATNESKCQRSAIEAYGVTEDILATLQEIVKKSAAKGKFHVPLHESSYHVTMEKIGFKKQELTITVAKGESTDLNIGLEKE